MPRWMPNTLPVSDSHVRPCPIRSSMAEQPKLVGFRFKSGRIDLCRRVEVVRNGVSHMSLKQLVATEASLIVSVKMATQAVNQVGVTSLNEAVSELAAALRTAKDRLDSQVTAINVLLGDLIGDYADAAATLNVDATDAATERLKIDAPQTPGVPQDATENEDAPEVEEKTARPSYATVAAANRLSGELSQVKEENKTIGKSFAAVNGTH